MIFLTLLSAALFAFPVAVTVGVYIGIEHQRVFNGDSHFSPWNPGSNTDPGSRYSLETYCQKAYGIEPFPGRYIFNPNQWGVKNNEGELCMNITTDKTATKDSTAAGVFSVTYNYPPGPPEEPVHAFPNAKLQMNDTLPVQLSNMETLILDAVWTYGLGSVIVNDTDSASLTEAGLNANVAVDMFLASDKQKSTSTTDSDYEVMVWLGRWGNATQPIGILDGSKDTHEINGTVFDLYYGANGLGQRVFTWVADTNTTNFYGDISPLVQRLGNSTGPVPVDYMGYAAFGTEALYSVQNVTFFVPELFMDITTVE
ncbi:glycoside hydrolase family 12 protein [Aulographum hederae CBS 113979]|uniref:Glycoside hydrolase family 12 protein n=1 Tax=Aulographum hederae CBS 113979 TaxID=1176131 RepID=A0A6G1HCE8_9PEZI|nr:glycoside hydrolase family 12 protein [Aulographum hederae CBS 113979]